MSKPENYKFVCDADTDLERKCRIAKLKQQFESQSNFASFSDSGYIEDSTGIPDLDENFAAERALLDIRRHLIRADLEKTLVPQLQAKNAITKRNAQRKAEFEKQLQKNY